MGLRDTISMIVERRHDAALANLAPLTARYHTFQFPLQGSELFQTRSNILELILSDRFDDCTVFAGIGLQGDQLPDCLRRKSQFAARTDERLALNSIIPLESLSAITAIRLSHQADGFIIANGRNFHARCLG